MEESSALALIELEVERRENDVARLARDIISRRMKCGLLQMKRDESRESEGSDGTVLLAI